MSWVVQAANGEVFAVRDKYEDAVRAGSRAEAYLDEAARCGHPKAPAWAASHLPLQMYEVTDPDELASLLEEGTPVLDREP